jgi:hypothetical protein
VHLVATGQHQRAYIAAQQLVERQDHHLLMCRVRGLEAFRLQRLGGPYGEIGQAHAARGMRQLLPLRLRVFVQAQRRQHLRTGGVALEQRPAAAAAQQFAHGLQPLRQRPVALHRFAPRVGALDQRGPR